MTSRILRAVIDDDCREADPARAHALRHYQQVIAEAWRDPSGENAAAKRRLDYFCGHIDAAPGLHDFVTGTEVARHYTSLNPAPTVEARGPFLEDLAIYLTLLRVERREGRDGAEFRGAMVALTFDRARHDANMMRIVGDGGGPTYQKRYETPRNMRTR